MSDDVEMRDKKIKDEDPMEHGDLIRWAIWHYIFEYEYFLQYNRDILNNFHEQFNTKLINKVSKIPLANKQIDKPETKSQS